MPNRRLGVGSQHAFEFPPAVADAVRALAVREQASLYSVLLTAFAAAVGRYAQQRSVVIAAPVTRRDNPATQLIMGPFMNTVPLHIDLSEADLAGLIHRVKSQVVQALANQDAPWQLVLDALTARHGPAARGIGETVFLMDDPVPGRFAAGQFTLTRIPPEQVVARRELTVAMNTKGRQVSGTVTYDGGLFAPETINRLVADFISVFSPSLADLHGGLEEDHMSSLRDADFEHTGPGRPAGHLLRQHWQPVYVSEELETGRAVPLKIVHEELTLYRGEDGAAHIIGGRCAHRGVQLSVGIVEGNCIRCRYHGWQYDETGQCVDQPAEPHSFAAKVQIPSYPVAEYFGFIWVYLGASPVPELPRWPELEQYGRFHVIELRKWNYFHDLENTVDDVHQYWVHKTGVYADDGVAGEIPRMTAEPTDFGLVQSSAFNSRLRPSAGAAHAEHPLLQFGGRGAARIPAASCGMSRSTTRTT